MNPAVEVSGGSVFSSRPIFDSPITTADSIKRKNPTNDKCSLCDEYLSNVFEGEKIIDLSCHCMTHLECYLTELAFGKENSNEELEKFWCKNCNILTYCMDTSLIDDKKMFENIQDLHLSNEEIIHTPIIDEILTPPITPQEQIGDKFWERDSNIDPLKIEIADEIVQLAQLSVSSKKVDDGFACTLKVKTADFNTDVNKGDEIQIEIEKYKLAQCIIDDYINQHCELVNILNLGELKIFDIADSISIKTIKFVNSQIYLFEYALIILNNKGDELIFYQELTNENFISSIYSNNEKKLIIINLNSIQIPNISIHSKNIILIHKWFTILNQFISKHLINLPIYQLSTNGWPLISNDELIPQQVQVLNKLLTKKLDIPAGLLRKQLIKPDLIPLRLIIAIPLFNLEEYEINDEEFIKKIKEIIKLILNSLDDFDKLGLVFIHSKNDLLGNYYGMASPDWDGWNDVLSNITIETISNTQKDDTPITATSNKFTQWNALKYIAILQKLIDHNNNNNNHTGTTNEIIFITNELIDFKNCDLSILINKRKPFGNKIEKEKFKPKDLIDLFCVNRTNFHTVLVSDEFKYNAKELYKQHSLFSNENNNFSKFYHAIDLMALSNCLQELIHSQKNTIISKLTISTENVDFQLQNLSTSYSHEFYLHSKNSKLSTLLITPTDTISKNFNLKPQLKFELSPSDDEFMISPTYKKDQVDEIKQLLVDTLILNFKREEFLNGVLNLNDCLVKDELIKLGDSLKGRNIDWARIRALYKYWELGGV